MEKMENDDMTWERIYADIDTILNGGEPEYPEKSKQEESRRKMNQPMKVKST
jgi:hypothetical protein